MAFYLKKISKAIEDLQKWGDGQALDVGDSPNLEAVRHFLVSWSNPWILVYLSTPRLYICSFFGMPNWDKKPFEFLKNWNESCPNRHYIDENLNLCDPYNREIESIQRREPLVYLRHFEGFKAADVNRYELNQIFLQTADVCLLNEKKAYCKMDIYGDYNDLIYLEEDPSLNLVWIAVHRDILDPFLQSTNYLLYRQFDFHFGAEKDGREISRYNTEFLFEDELYYAQQTTLKFNSMQKTVFFRGAEILKPCLSREECINKMFGEKPCYESFWVKDLYTKKMVYTSCARDALGNFFVESNKPHEISRAFFKPEVLSKYKSDPGKYSLDGGHLSCRGGWWLRSCYITEANEVYSYICDIGSLPYKEQLHWKAYNIEKPIGESLASADARDLQAEWVYIDEIRGTLSSVLRNFPDVVLDTKKIAIWKSKNSDIDIAFNEIQPVVTDSTKEFKDFIAALARLTTEGLLDKGIRTWTIQLGIREEQLKKSGTGSWLGSIKLLHVCLLKLLDKDQADKMHRILSTLHQDKSKQTSHGGAQEPKGHLRLEAEKIFGEVTWAFVELKSIIDKYNLSEI